jgi:hypothetical protein
MIFNSNCSTPTTLISSTLKEMEKDGKRKMPFTRQSSGSNVRPHFSQPN